MTTSGAIKEPSEQVETPVTALTGLSLHEPARSSGLRVVCFEETAPDALIHGQIIDLGCQIFVWLGVGGARLGNLMLAIQTRAVRHTNRAGERHYYAAAPQQHTAAQPSCRLLKCKQ